MPNKVVAWSCQYGCKRRVTTSKEAMYKHEETCFHNPVNKACATCGNLATWLETIYDPPHGGNPGSSDYEVEKKACEFYDIKEKWRHHCDKWCAPEEIK